MNITRLGYKIEATVPVGRCCVECFAQDGVEEPASWTVYDTNSPDDEIYLCHFHVRIYQE